MLLLVLILVLAAFGLLVVALLTNGVLWAWVSVAVSVAAGVVLIVDWLQRRSAVRAGATSSSDGANADTVSRAEAEPATEVLPVVAVARGGPTGGPPDSDHERSDSVADAQQTVLMPVVQPPGSAGRPSGATPAVTPSSLFSSLSVTESRASELDRTSSRPAPSDDVDSAAVVAPSLVKDASAPARPSGAPSRHDSPAGSTGTHVGVSSTTPEHSGSDGEPDAPARVDPAREGEATVLTAADPPTRGPVDQGAPDQAGAALSPSGTAEGPPVTVDTARPATTPTVSTGETGSQPGDRAQDPDPDPTDLDRSRPGRTDDTVADDPGRPANGAQVSEPDAEHSNRSGAVPGVVQQAGAQPADAQLDDAQPDDAQPDDAQALVSGPDVGAFAGDQVVAGQYRPGEYGSDQPGSDQPGSNRFGAGENGADENAADQYGDGDQASDRFVADEPPEEPRSDAATLVAALEDEVVVIDEEPRYHVTGCRALARVTVIPLPVREAVELGFTPCGWCSPDRTLAGRHPAAAR